MLEGQALRVTGQLDKAVLSLLLGISYDLRMLGHHIFNAVAQVRTHVPQQSGHWLDPSTMASRGQRHADGEKAHPAGRSRCCHREPAPGPSCSARHGRGLFCSPGAGTRPPEGQLSVLRHRVLGTSSCSLAPPGLGTLCPASFSQGAPSTSQEHPRHLDPSRLRVTAGWLQQDSSPHKAVLPLPLHLAASFPSIPGADFTHTWGVYHTLPP